MAFARWRQYEPIQYMVLGPNRVTILKGIAIGLVVIAGLKVVVTSRPTDRHDDHAVTTGRYNYNDMRQ